MCQQPPDASSPVRLTLSNLSQGHLPRCLKESYSQGWEEISFFRKYECYEKDTNPNSCLTEGIKATE